MKRLWFLLVVAGCAPNRGIALDLAIRGNCALPVSIARVDFAVRATPPLAQPSFTVAGDKLSSRVVLLFPQATTRVDIMASALDQSGKELGADTQHFFFAGPGSYSGSISLGDAGCPVRSYDLAGGINDLASSPPDLVPPVAVTSVEWQGYFGTTVYEAEGYNPLGDAQYGIPVFITGTNLGGVPISVDPYATLGPVYYSSDGTHVATSILLPVDTMLTAETTKSLTLSIGDIKKTLVVNGLDELTPAQSSLMQNTDMPIKFSQGSLKYNLSMNGLPRAFLWFASTLDGAGSGDISVSSGNNGGFPGCTLSMCDNNGNGIGHGQSAGSNATAPGAGYRNGGGNGGVAGGGGITYGDPSLVGMPGGSGGGNSSDTNGGSGGGVLRVVAGQIVGMQFIAGGGQGAANAIFTHFGGGGSGGTALIQAFFGIASSAINTYGNFDGHGSSGSTGNGSEGRARLDIGAGSPGVKPQPSIDYIGAMINAATPTAFQHMPTMLGVWCGTGSVLSTFELDVFDSGHTSPRTLAGPFTCPASANSTTGVDIDQIQWGAASTAGIHTVCTKILNTGTTTPWYQGELSENLSCRRIVAADP